MGPVCLSPCFTGNSLQRSSLPQSKLAWRWCGGVGRNVHLSYRVIASHYMARSWRQTHQPLPLLTVEEQESLLSHLSSMNSCAHLLRITGKSSLSNDLDLILLFDCEIQCRAVLVIVGIK